MSVYRLAFSNVDTHSWLVGVGMNTWGLPGSEVYSPDGCDDGGHCTEFQSTAPFLLPPGVVRCANI